MLDALSPGRPERSRRACGTASPTARRALAPRSADPGHDAAGPPRVVAGLVGALSRPQRRRARRDRRPRADHRRPRRHRPPPGGRRRPRHQGLVARRHQPRRHQPRLQPARAVGGAEHLRRGRARRAGAPPGCRRAPRCCSSDTAWAGMVAVAAAGRAQAMGYRVGRRRHRRAPRSGRSRPRRGAGARAGERPRRRAPPRRRDEPRRAGRHHRHRATTDHGTLGDNHGLATAYLPGAADVDASTDPAVVAARDRLAPFLTADTVDDPRVRRAAGGTREAAGPAPCRAAGSSRRMRLVLGLMQETPLTVNLVFERGRQYWGSRTIMTKTVDGEERRRSPRRPRRSWCWPRRSTGWASTADARIGTFGWNTAPPPADLLRRADDRPGAAHRQHPAVPGAVRVHRRARRGPVMFVDRSLLPLFTKYLPLLTTVQHVVVFDDGAPHELPDDPRVRRYEDLVAGVAPADPVELAARVTDENTACGLCYTTGTTGNPKGVLYSHRSTYLHAAAAMYANTLAPHRRRHRPAGRADVPRQRLGPALRRLARRREHGHAGSGHDARRPARPHRRRAGHGHRRRADDLDGHGAAARGARRVVACGGS